VVAEVGADAAQRMHDRHAEAREQIRRPDARDLQQPRRVHRAGREDHLPSCAHLALRRAARGLVADAHCTQPLEHDAARARIRPHLKIRARHGGLEEGARGGDAAAAMDGALVVADARLVAAIVVPRAGDAERQAALDEGLGHRVDPVHVGDRDAPLAPAARVVAGADAVLAAAIVRQAVGIAPAAQPALRPGVEVRGLAAVVDHPVHRGGAAERAPLRRADAPPAVIGMPSVLNCQVTEGSASVLMKPAGMWIQGFRSGGPPPARRP
jgi:hypothetical protein